MLPRVKNNVHPLMYTPLDENYERICFIECHRELLELIAFKLIGSARCFENQRSKFVNEVLLNSSQRFLHTYREMVEIMHEMRLLDEELGNKRYETRIEDSFWPEKKVYIREVESHYSQVYSFISKALQEKNLDIVEVGSGKFGLKILKRLKEQGGNVRTVDRQSKLEYYANEENIPFTRGRLENLTSALETAVDIIYIANMDPNPSGKGDIQRFSSGDEVLRFNIQIAKEIYQSLKPNGVFLAPLALKPGCLNYFIPNFVIFEEAGFEFTYLEVPYLCESKRIEEVVAQKDNNKLMIFQKVD